MPARLLGLPFLLLFVWSIYAAWGAEDDRLAYPILVAAILVALVYVFSPEINWWFYRRWTPRLDPPVKHLLGQFGGYYNSLSEAERDTFEQRLFLTVTATDFLAQGLPSVPEDIRYMIAYPQVCLNFHQKEWLCKRSEKTVVYPHPFPSPAHPNRLHYSEWYAEDGVLIYVLPWVVEGFTRPGAVYNIVFHEQAKVFRDCRPDLSLPEMAEAGIWKKLEAVSGMSWEYITKIVGLPQEDPYPISVHHFFLYPEAFQRELPALHASYLRVFGGNEV